jgi:hypothetical protein
MMAFLAKVVVWLNAAANTAGTWLLAPIAYLPGWLSVTIVAVISGMLMLVVFKYTSNQRAIKRAKDDIKANLLALKLFKDNVWVALRAQLHILSGAGRLLVLAFVPTLVMVVPVCLLLGQLAPWYQARPVHVGEDVVVIMHLSGDAGSAWPEVRLRSMNTVESIIGPVRGFSTRTIYWGVRGIESGYHKLVFEVGNATVDKEIAVGDGFMRVSAIRPARNWSETLLYPCEEPFGPDSQVRSIEIEYPERSSRISGTDSWVLYWLGVSMVAAFCCRRLFKVNL